jgi:hypothetical protein
LSTLGRIGGIKVKQVEIAKFFGISRATVSDWKRAGCPLNGDLGDVAAWRTRRKLREYPDNAVPGLPELVGAFTRQLIDLDRRIALVNQWPEDMEAEPGVIKAAVVSGLILERALLQLPGRVLAEAKPETLPEDVHRIVLAVLAESRGKEDEQTQSRLSGRKR